MFESLAVYKSTSFGYKIIELNKSCVLFDHVSFETGR